MIGVTGSCMAAHRNHIFARIILDSPSPRKLIAWNNNVKPNLITAGFNQNDLADEFNVQEAPAGWSHRDVAVFVAPQSRQVKDLTLTV